MYYRTGTIIPVRSRGGIKDVVKGKSRDRCCGSGGMERHCMCQLNWNWDQSDSAKALLNKGANVCRNAID